MESKRRPHDEMLGIRRWVLRRQHDAPVIVNLIDKPTAVIMVIGEAPNQKTTGPLLTAMINMLGCQHDEICYAEAPTDQTEATLLQQQISLTQPRLLLILGHSAAQYLLTTASSPTSARANTRQYGDANIPVIVTHHPLQLLKNPLDKKNTYADLLFAKYIINKITN